MPKTRMIIKRPALYESFKQELATKKAIYISGPTGWGKTTAVLDWLETTHKNHLYLSATQDDFAAAITNVTAKLIVIDDLQAIAGANEEQLLIAALTTRPNCRFILISRSALPAYLKPFQLTAQLTDYNYQALQFNRAMITDLAASYGLSDPLLPSQVETITQGYPMAVRLLFNRLKHGETLNELTAKRIVLDIFDCYDAILFNRLEADLQKFYLHMAAFDCYTEKMARLVTGNNNIQVIIDKALSSGSSLTFCPPDTYTVHPFFHRYLQWKQQHECSPEFIRSTYHNAALYYELEDNLGKALRYYQLCDNNEKIAELLILNSQRHPGNGHYYETETFYRALPKAKILTSPELMCGMCMLCSLSCQPEESEYWFEELQNYGNRLPKQDKNYKLVQGKLCYLKIALPHRGSKNITAILLDVARAYRTGAFRLQEFSVTSNMPSVLNGGKDFTGWVRHDRKLYHLMKKPCELILGRYGIGIADIAMAESLFEKAASDNLTEVMLLANAGQNAAAFAGTLEMEFAAAGILSRVMLLRNNLLSAYALLDNLKARAEKAKMAGLVNNIEALRIMLSLVEGKNEAVSLWLRNDAPDETQHFRTLERYRYMAKVRCYLGVGNNSDALNLLSRLLDYFQNYDRTYGQLEAGILLAITQYRMQQQGWQKTLDETLVRCEYYGFIRFVAEEGVALLPLLLEATLSTSAAYTQQIIKETRHYALLYPDYQKPRQVLAEQLTETEKNVLRLLCKGLSNEEIARLLGVGLRTVKFHTGNLYAKLNVKNRMQAIKAAVDLG